jgi:hypothetical protein
MTKLERQVRRAVAAGRRELVVILTPGETPTLELREKRRRSGFAIPLGALYVILAERAADVARAARAKRVRRSRFSRLAAR